jgi:predicted TIM-barrel fold metal-dependent hydrolase
MTPEHVLFGSDYPHPEGMAEPLNFAKEIDGLFSEADTRKIMGENMFELLGLR